MDGSSSGPMSANMFAPLSPLTKVQYPSATKKKKRFAKIREQIKGPNSAGY